MNPDRTEATVSVRLTDQELLLLDGSSQVKTQAEVNRAKIRILTRMDLLHLAPRQADFVANLKVAAMVEGKLVFRGTSLRHCGVCETYAGYATYKRDGRYHRKGDRNINKPRLLSGYEFVERFVVMEGYPSLGCCRSCWDAVCDDVHSEFVFIRAQMPEEVVTRSTKFIRYSNCECSACGWTGHDGQLRRLRALMRGDYAGGCPVCPAENVPFGKRLIETLDSFTVVEVQS